MILQVGAHFACYFTSSKFTTRRTDYTPSWHGRHGRYHSIPRANFYYKRRNLRRFHTFPTVKFHEQWTNPWLFAAKKGIILPSYVGSIINHYKDPYKTSRIQWKVRPGFFRGSHGCNEINDQWLEKLTKTASSAGSWFTILPTKCVLFGVSLPYTGISQDSKIKINIEDYLVIFHSKHILRICFSGCFDHHFILRYTCEVMFTNIPRCF